MTTINSDTNIDQNWIAINPSPWTINSGITVTLIGNISIESTDYFIMNTSSTIDGGGYIVYRFQTSNDSLARPSNDGQSNLLIKNVGVVLTQPSNTLQANKGAIFSTDYNAGANFYNSIQINIRSCYSNCILDSIDSAGIIGRAGTGGVYYITECYHIGVINEPVSNSAAGIIGNRVAQTSGVCFMLNCYQIGSITAGGALAGGYVASNNGELYMINCYFSDSNINNWIVPSGLSNTEKYIGYNKRYYYGLGSWVDNDAKSNLYTQESGGVVLNSDAITNYNIPIGTTGNYTQLSGTGSLTPAYIDTFDSYVNGYNNIYNPPPPSGTYYSYFKFPSLTNQPWGLYAYTISPYESAYYTTASSNATLAEGTDITVDTNIDQTWVDTHNIPWRLASGITVTFVSDLIFEPYHFFTMDDYSTIDGGGYKVTRQYTNNNSIGKPNGNSKVCTLKNIGVIIVPTNNCILTYQGAIFTSQYIDVSNGFNYFYDYTTVNIISCYSVSNLTSKNGGIVGRSGIANTMYIINSYHIGDISDPNSQSGGIVGEYCAAYTGKCILLNCYNYGTLSGSNGSLFGEHFAINSGKIYFINTHYNSTPFYAGLLGTAISYVGFNKNNDYSGGWTYANALANLYSEEPSGTELTSSAITTTGNYTQLFGSGSIVAQDLTDFNTYLGTIGLTSPYYSYIALEYYSNTSIWGLKNYIRYPYNTGYTSIVSGQATHGVPTGTLIDVNTTINQTWINSNPGPWTIGVSETTGLTVTIEENITISGGTSYFILKNNAVLDGNGHKIIHSDSGGAYSLVSVDDTSNLDSILIKNIGIILYQSASPQLISLFGGILFIPYSSVPISRTNIFIEKCYTIGDITESGSGGIVGSMNAGNYNNIYVTNCYHIGDSSSDSGGIMGSSIAKSGICFTMNCYNIGTSTGSIYGTGIGPNSGRCYAINCYHTSGSLYGSLDGGISCFAYKGIYLGNPWSDSTAIPSALGALYSEESGGSQLTSSVITTQSGYITVSGAIVQSDLNTFNGYLSTVFGYTSPYNSYFKFPLLTDQPWGLTYFYDISPYKSIYYTQATDEAYNCFCRGTKVTIIDKECNKIYISIENINIGMTVLTPHGINKKVVYVKKFRYNGSDNKHMPYLIPRDYFINGVPFEDTYSSGAHSLMYDKRNAEYLGLDLKVKKERVKERSNGMNLYLIKDFAIPQNFQKVSALKGDDSIENGFNYYHLMIEDNAGYFANGLASESLEL